MSENWSLAMLMKKNELKSLSGDVDEKKDGYLAQLGWWVVAQFDAVAASGVARRYLAPVCPEKERERLMCSVGGKPTEAKVRTS